MDSGIPARALEPTGQVPELRTLLAGNHRPPSGSDEREAAPEVSSYYCCSNIVLLVFWSGRVATDCKVDSLQERGFDP